VILSLKKSAIKEARDQYFAAGLEHGDQTHALARVRVRPDRKTLQRGL